MLHNNFKPKSKGLLKFTTPPSLDITNSLQHLPVTIYNHTFHKSKLLSLISLPMGTEVCTTQTCYSNKTGAAETLCSTMQGLVLPRQMPNPAPHPSNIFHQLPRAAGLESSSHGVTQSKMLTNFLTLSHENKGRLMLIH